jgi:hypothetical protein
MAEEQTKEGVYSQINEPTVKFKLISDRIIREVINAETKQTLVHISGYDLQINFNMQFLKSVEDVEAACEGITQLFRDMIMTQLLKGNKQSEQ